MPFVVEFGDGCLVYAAGFFVDRLDKVRRLSG